MGHAAKQGSELCCSIRGAAAVVVTGLAEPAFHEYRTGVTTCSKGGVE